VNYGAKKIITHPAFETGSIMLIIINSLFLALEDPTLTVQAYYLDLVTSKHLLQSETIFLYIYTVEMVIKILALGFALNRGSYIRDPWNVLDFTIVVSGYLPVIIGSNSSINLNGLRSLRVLRPLKTVTAIKKLRSLILTIFNAIPYLLEIMVVLLFVFLIFAIAGLQLFTGLLQNRCIDITTGRPYFIPNNQYGGFCTKTSCPTADILGNPISLICAKCNSNPDSGNTNFDNIFSSFLMVYVVTSLEGWTYIMSIMQMSFTYYSSLFFILIVFICAFFLINLTLAVITIKFNESQDKSKQEEIKSQKFSKISILWKKTTIISS
jgi:Ion transport protein